jgi:hypothetical protein
MVGRLLRRLLTHREPWNKGKIVVQKPPFKLKNNLPERGWRDQALRSSLRARNAP